MITVPKLLSILRKAKNDKDIDYYRNDILELIPALSIMIDYDQQNYAHQYDLWFHCLNTVVNLPKDIDDDMVYLAALLHDIGKPECQTIGKKDGKVNMHYYGHPEVSERIVHKDIVPLLSLSEDDSRRLLYYVLYHDDRVSLRIKHLRRHLNMGYSLDEFKNLMKLQVADARAHILIPVILDRIEICSNLSGSYADKLYNDIMEGK